VSEKASEKDSDQESDERDNHLPNIEEEKVEIEEGAETYFSTQLLSDLPVSEQTLKGIKELGFTKATEIQARAIPHILNGRDVLGQAKTGSGKTLAYMVPAVELLRRANFTPKNGTGVLIICPTRELAMHNYKWARDLL
jgi:ATP-dependent RNA helicase DDX18/HAS1